MQTDPTAVRLADRLDEHRLREIVQEEIEAALLPILARLADRLEAFGRTRPGPRLRLVEPAPEPVRLPDFTDEELLAALGAACEQWAEAAEKSDWPRREPGVWSSCVARVLAGGHAFERTVPPTVVAGGDVIRVGRALGRAERAGLVRRVNKTWESRRWARA